MNRTKIIVALSEELQYDSVDIEDVFDYLDVVKSFSYFDKAAYVRYITSYKPNIRKEHAEEVLRGWIVSWQIS